MKKMYFMSVVLFAILMNVANTFGQESNKTYKVFTYTVVGSNDSNAGSNLSKDLSKAFADIKNDFGFSNYQVLSTQFQLIKQNGNIAYKSIMKSSDFSGESEMPIFADWTYQGFDEAEKQAGFKSFRFNMRFPMRNVSSGKEGESFATTVYEQVGLSAQNIDFAVGKPVLFASFPVDITNKTLFFIVHLEEVK